MVIDRIGSGFVRPAVPADVNESDGATEDESPNTLSSRGKRSDSVVLSKQGLARAAELSNEAGSGVSAERLSEIRTRIASSFYNDPSVALETAQGLNDSGDLQSDPSFTS